MRSVDVDELDLGLGEQSLEVGAALFPFRPSTTQVSSTRLTTERTSAQLRSAR